MTPEQKMLVKESWAKVVPIKEQAAALFYGRLFETYPEVKPYFEGNMNEQGRKLMLMLNTAVNGLDNLPMTLDLAAGARSAAAWRGPSPTGSRSGSSLAGANRARHPHMMRGLECALLHQGSAAPTLVMELG